MKKENLYCSDGVLVTAIAKQLKKKWTLFGISKVHGFGDAEFNKVLFDTTFDEIIPFNSMSGVSYVAVKKDGLWGLIRFRIDPESAVHKEGYRKAIGNEPLDEKAVDAIGREIKMIEEIKYPDITAFKKKYKLDIPDMPPSNEKDSKKGPEENHGWSDSLKEYTKDALVNLEFGFSPEGTVRMKRSDGSFGFISIADASSNKYNVHHDEDGSVDHYDNVQDMIEDGWALD